MRVNIGQVYLALKRKPVTVTVVIASYDFNSINAPNTIHPELWTAAIACYPDLTP